MRKTDEECVEGCKGYHSEASEGAESSAFHLDMQEHQSEYTLEPPTFSLHSPHSPLSITFNF